MEGPLESLSLPKHWQEYFIEHNVLCAILGATGTGKSSLAELWAESWSVELINADASSFFRFMDIGTAKPRKSQTKLLGLHLVDCCEPGDSFSLHDYIQAVPPILESIRKKKRTPLLVGGSGLYARAILEGFVLPNISVDEEKRAYWYSQSVEALRDELLARLENASDYVDMHNPRRLVRALEILDSGLGVEDIVGRRQPPDFPVLKFLLDIEPSVHQRLIAQRCQAMIDEGWLDEVAWLDNHGYREAAIQTRAIGYQQAFEVLDGSLSLSEFSQQVIEKTLGLVKRQKTWLRKEQDVHTLKLGYGGDLLDFRNECISQIRDVIQSLYGKASPESSW